MTERGIEANPKQIAALIDTLPPRSVREVQRLTGKITVLNRFISRSTERCLPFYKLLKGNKKFDWNEECDSALKELKAYISETPILSKPIVGETLFLYVAASEHAVSGVLIHEKNGEQRPIYYVSRSLVDAETRYPVMEKLVLAVVTAARKLAPSATHNWSQANFMENMEQRMKEWNHTSQFSEKSLSSSTNLS